MLNSRSLLPIIGLFLTITSAYAGSAIHMEGQLSEIRGNPSWLILIRNPDTGTVVPWLYDFKNKSSYWTVRPRGYHYQIIASELQFNHAVFHNFCNIEDGILSGQSLQMRLSGELAPDTKTLRCRVTFYPGA